MDNFISDPENNRSNVVARVVKIKSEKNIQRHLGIKVELGSDITDKDQALTTTLSEKPKIETMANEKSNLVVEILVLKSENQKTCFELNEKER